jgi:hypothetical protein
MFHIFIQQTSLVVAERASHMIARFEWIVLDLAAMVVLRAAQ